LTRRFGLHIIGLQQYAQRKSRRLGLTRSARPGEAALTAGLCRYRPIPWFFHDCAPGRWSGKF
jgi:hypothetical protein